MYFEKKTTYKFPAKDLYLNFNTLAIPELHIEQLLILTHKFLHHRYLLPNAFANYFTVNSAIHSYNTECEKICIWILFIKIWQRNCKIHNT